MKLLILASEYPDNSGEIGLNYIHTRNLFYKEDKSIDMVVINFKASDDYIKDGIKVITLNSYKKNYIHQHFDILISHAPNIKNHFLFLYKYGQAFPRIVFFFHGHEVLKVKEDYPKPYPFSKKDIVRTTVNPIYDIIKLKVCSNYIKKHIDKIHLVFVSEWMYDKFIEHTGIQGSTIQDRVHIIYNSVSKRYEKDTYDAECDKEYDLITIRGCIDTPKFAIDLVNKLAWNNPDLKFLLVGKGDFFKYNEKAPNLERLEKYLNQDEIVELLDKSRYALMPTRTDAQGVMACEMATYGIPLITSDIPVCRYVLSGFQNVAYIDNDTDGKNLSLILKDLKPANKKEDRFFNDITVGKEIALYKEIVTQE